MIDHESLQIAAARVAARRVSGASAQNEITRQCEIVLQDLCGSGALAAGLVTAAPSPPVNAETVRLILSPLLTVIVGGS